MSEEEWVKTFKRERELWEEYQDSAPNDHELGDLEDRLVDELDRFKFDGDQDSFVKFMVLARDAAWDIPSALGTICHHGGEVTNEGDFYMHRSEYWPHNDWDRIDDHFREKHQLDLLDIRLDWRFST